MTAVPCWLSWNTGIASVCRNAASMAKQSGARISSRLIPPTVGSRSWQTLMMSAGSSDAISRSNASHPNDLPPAEHPAAVTTGDPKDQQNQQEQEKLLAQQDQERRDLQQKQDQDHQQLAQQKADAATTQKLEEQHTQQTQQLAQKHAQQMQTLKQHQQPPHQDEPKKDKP
jgi:hypothetical protein